MAKFRRNIVYGCMLEEGGSSLKYVLEIRRVGTLYILNRVLRKIARERERLSCGES